MMEEKYDLAKWLSGEMDAAELEAFEKDPNYATYAGIKEYSGQLTAPSFDENEMYSRIAESKTKSKKVIKMQQFSWLKIAALVILFVGIGILVKNYVPKTQIAENGSITSFNLPDRSQVVMNSGSELSYKKWNWNSNRKVSLDGEAYFHVAKGSTFEVNTDLGKVTVLGTKFNVKARENRFDVTCYEGRVKVAYGNFTRIIIKGQRLTFNDGKLVETPQTEVSSPEWMHGELVFAKESCSEVAAAIGRHHNVEISLKGVESQQLFSGTLPIKNLEESLRIIETTYHLKSVRNGDKIILEPVNVQN